MSHDRDERWVDLAKILASHSTAVSKNDRVLIVMREPETFPLAREIYRQAIARGAFPQTLFTSVFFERDKLLEGTEEQVGWVPELFYKGMEWADVCFDLRGATNLHELSGVDTALVAAHRKAEGKISALRTSGTRWVIVRVPSPTLAQAAGTSTDTAMGVFFDACLIDWQAEELSLQAFAARLTGGKRLRLLAPSTDLSFSIEGRTFVAEAGHINMPGGEIYTSPVEESVEGRITFESPGVFAGLLMEKISLTFQGGKVVEASAESNNEFLRNILDTDVGARYVGEFGIGTNRGLTFFSNDILYDEKIYGTVHIALANESGTRERGALFPGDRERIRLYASQTALDLVRRYFLAKQRESGKAKIE